MALYKKVIFNVKDQSFSSEETTDSFTLENVEEKFVVRNGRAVKTVEVPVPRELLKKALEVAGSGFIRKIRIYDEKIEFYFYQKGTLVTIDE